MHSMQIQQESQGTYGTADKDFCTETMINLTKIQNTVYDETKLNLLFEIL